MKVKLLYKCTHLSQVGLRRDTTPVRYQWTKSHCSCNGNDHELPHNRLLGKSKDRWHSHEHIGRAFRKHYSYLAHKLALGSMNNGFIYMQFNISLRLIPNTDAHTPLATHDSSKRSRYLSSFLFTRNSRGHLAFIRRLTPSNPATMVRFSLCIEMWVPSPATHRKKAVAREYTSHPSSLNPDPLQVCGCFISNDFR